MAPLLPPLPPLPSRFDSNSGANAQDTELDSPTAASIIESQLVRREGSMHLPRPADCNVQGTHSDMCIVRVRRNHLVEDALDEIARQYRCVCWLGSSGAGIGTGHVITEAGSPCFAMARHGVCTSTPHRHDY